MTRAVGFLFTLTMLFIVAWQTLYAQWTWQSPHPQGNTLLRVQFVDSNRGWTIGEFGTIIHTTNGGVTWIEQSQPRSTHLRSIFIHSGGQAGWAVGDSGLILRTTNGGVSWLEQASGTTQDLHSVRFFDSFVGWITGGEGIILRTSNGGIQWAIQRHSTSEGIIYDVHPLTRLDAWAVGDSNLLYRTTNAGTLWSKRMVGENPSISLKSVTFVDTYLGYLVGSMGTIYRTENSGVTWSRVEQMEAIDLNQVQMQNHFVGFITGNDGTLYRTINGGLSWSKMVIGNTGHLYGLWNKSGWIYVVGEDGGILRSTNNGLGWARLDTGPRSDLTAMSFPSGSLGYAVGRSGMILRSTDTARTWFQLSAPEPSIDLNGVAFFNESRGWIVGQNGTILRTTDGSTWSSQTSPVSGPLHGIVFSDPTNGWIVGGSAGAANGLILRSTNGGSSWVLHRTVSNVLRAITFSTPTIGWAVGDQGLIARTSDGGSNWIAQASGTSLSIRACAFVDPNNGWAVGDSGLVLQTTNGGATWNHQHSGINVTLTSIAVLSILDVIIVGDRGTILSTVDGGITWERQSAKTGHDLAGVAIPVVNTLVTCGVKGTILRKSVPFQGGTVVGHVFNDMNGNGSRDPGEPVIGGRKIILSGTTRDSTYSATDGSFRFQNLPLGNYLLSEELPPMWTQTRPGTQAGYSFALTLGNLTFAGTFGNLSSASRSYHVNANWNLVSVPLQMPDSRTTTIFPLAASSAYAYNAGYYSAEAIQPGQGYWMRFEEDQTIWVAGNRILSDSIAVRQGWNLIGSIDDSISVENIRTSPPGLIISSFFTFTTSYTRAEKLYPGKGYWVKTSGPGLIILGISGAAARQFSNSTNEVIGCSVRNNLEFIDSSGASGILFFTKGPLTTSSHFELPPLPPSGGFDVRFEGDRDHVSFSRTHHLQSVGISLQSQSFPISVTWRKPADESEYTIVGKNSGKVILRLSGVKGSGQIEWSDLHDGLQLVASSRSPEATSPSKYELLQNVPNPSNPSTIIPFALPYRSLVSLEIFNALGQKVATLVESELESGYHESRWSSSEASGTYFYRLEAKDLEGSADRYTETRKMIIIR